MKDLTVLDQLIVGRVDPHIYAFSTNTIPNYLKVGDTYRPVAIRLQEWREHFPDLQKEYEHIAKVSDDIYFRDYAVHTFLEEERHRARLFPSDIAQGVYYSREFFKDTSEEDLDRLMIANLDYVVQRYNEDAVRLNNGETTVDLFLAEGPSMTADGLERLVERPD